MYIELHIWINIYIYVHSATKYILNWIIYIYINFIVQIIYSFIHIDIYDIYIHTCIHLISLFLLLTFSPPSEKEKWGEPIVIKTKSNSNGFYSIFAEWMDGFGWKSAPSGHKFRRIRSYYKTFINWDFAKNRTEILFFFFFIIGLIWN